MSNAGAKHVGARLAGVGIGLRNVFAFLTRDDDETTPSNATPSNAGTPAAGPASTATATATTARLCRKPMAKGFRCYCVDGHPPPCQPEAIDR